MCITELQAAVLLDRLGHLDKENRLRAERVELLSSLLAETLPSVRMLPRQKDAEQTYYNLILDLDIAAFGGNSVDVVARALCEELDVLCHPIYKPMNVHPLYRPLNSARAPRDAERKHEMDPARFDLPNAVAARTHFLALQHFLLLDAPSGMHDIVAALRKIQAHASDLSKLSQ
jgi:dTDP-4-amino-4,6-dideoxygalactose transaminase